MHETDPGESNDVEPAEGSPEEAFALWMRREEEQRAAAAKRLAEIFAAVRRDFPRRRYFVAGYHGYGDEGSLEYAGFLEDEAQSAEAVPWSAPDELVSDFPPGVDEAEVEELLDQFLPGGYGESDGGQGVVRIDLVTGQLEVAHEWNVTEVQEDHRSYGLGPIVPAALRRTRRTPGTRGRGRVGRARRSAC
jgi:hypothetical protein